MNTFQCNKRQFLTIIFVISVSKYVNMGKIPDIATKVGVIGALDFPHRV